VFYRVLATLFAGLGLTIVSATPALAQTPADWTFGALYDVVFHAGSETSSVGAHFDVARQVQQLTNSDVQALGEIGFNHFEGATFSSFLVGGRWTGHVNPKTSPFLQLLLGLNHVSESSDFAIQPGVGVDYAWSPNLTLRAQLDFRRVFFEGSGETATRFGIGVVVPFNVR
jgi:hypothetical protein